MALNHTNPGAQPHDSAPGPVALNRTTPGPQDRQYSQTGVSIKRLVQTLRPLRAVMITVAGQPIQAQPRLTAEAEAILAKIPRGAGH